MNEWTAADNSVKSNFSGFSKIDYLFEESTKFRFQRTLFVDACQRRTLRRRKRPPSKPSLIHVEDTRFDKEGRRSISLLLLCNKSLWLSSTGAEQHQEHNNALLYIKYTATSTCWAAPPQPTSFLARFAFVWALSGKRSEKDERKGIHPTVHNFNASTNSRAFIRWLTHRVRN